MNMLHSTALRHPQAMHRQRSTISSHEQPVCTSMFQTYSVMPVKQYSARAPAKPGQQNTYAHRVVSTPHKIKSSKHKPLASVTSACVCCVAAHSASDVTPLCKMPTWRAVYTQLLHPACTCFIHRIQLILQLTHPILSPHCRICQLSVLCNHNCCILHAFDWYSGSSSSCT
jgi:hypothetical protein